MTVTVTRAWVADYYRRQGVTDPRRFPDSAEPSEPPKKVKVPNKTEALYAATFLDQTVRDVTYEGITLRLKNGHRYTPDWVECGKVTRYPYEKYISLHEVKGSYRHASHQRARLAFDQARLDWPQFWFVWAVKQKDGTWKREAWKGERCLSDESPGTG